MTRHLYIFFLTCLTYGLCSCSKNEIDINENPSKMVFGLSFEEDSRTSLSADRTSLLWTTGDEILVTDALGNTAIATVSEKDNGKKAIKIVVEGVRKAPFTFLYPASALKKEDILLPHSQKYTLGNIANNMSVLYGQTSTSNVALHCLNSFIRIATNPTVRNITLEATAGETLTGYHALDREHFTLTPKAGNSAIRIESIPSAVSQIILAIPAQRYEKGFTVRILTQDNKLKYITAYSTGRELSPGTVLNMPTINVDGLESVTGSTISTGAEFVAWLKSSAASCTSNDVVYLTNDIDLSGLTVTSAPSFAGTFDGQGFLIKNWNANCPLFLANNGFVKNITLDSSCKLTIPDASNSFGFIVGTNNKEVTGCINMADATFDGAFNSSSFYGCIVGYSTAHEDAFVRNCINHGNLTIKATAQQLGVSFVGGVCGRFYGVNTSESGIYDCVNTGVITINFTGNESVNTKNIQIGGVTGSSNAGTRTMSCTNTGDIFVNTKGQGAAIVIGGVSSYSAGKTYGCVNYGNITVTSEKTPGAQDGQIKALAFGGILGYENGPLSNCKNYGNLTTYCSIFAGRNSIGGIDGSTSYSSAAPAMGGICGYGYDSSSSHFYIKNSVNYGNITYIQHACDIAGNTYSGRHAFGGICAAPYGNIEECTNYGNLNIVLTSKNRVNFSDLNVMPIVGGISGGDYYPKGQNSTNILHCKNYGDIDVTCDFSNSNCAYGGIVGWPSLENESQTTIREYCENYGNITSRGFGKSRVGGISGGSGHMNNCICKDCTITMYDTKAISTMGGLIGYLSRQHKVSNCTLENVSVISTVALTQGAGLIAGNLGNATNNSCDNLRIDGTLSVPTGSIYGIFGLFSGAADMTLGPIMVRGKINGQTITKSNLQSLITNSSNYSPSTQKVDISLWE